MDFIGGCEKNIGQKESTTRMRSSVFPDARHAQILALSGAASGKETVAHARIKCFSAVLVRCISIISSSAKDYLQTEVAER